MTDGKNSLGESDFLYHEDSSGRVRLVHSIDHSAGFTFQSLGVSLHDGDLLHIEPHGKATVIYDSSSRTNSIFLTEECNCRCLFCPQPPVKHDSRDWVQLAVDSIRLMDPAPECLGITGGEPTAKWDGLIRVLESCGQYLPDTSIQLLSNGRVFKEFHKAEALSGKTGNNLIVGIPLHSDSDDLHDRLAGRQGAFWETIAGINNLHRFNIPVELRIVISKQNYSRLPQLAEFIYRTIPFVSCVAFMALEPIGKAYENRGEVWIDTAEYLPNLEEAVHFLWQREIQPLLFNHQLCTLPERLWAVSVKSISGWKIRYVDNCRFCEEKSRCGGLFFSAAPFLAGKLKPIRREKDGR